MKKLLFLALMGISMLQGGGPGNYKDLENFFKYSSLATFIFSAPVTAYLGKQTYVALKQKNYYKASSFAAFTLLGTLIASTSGFFAAFSIKESFK